MDTEKVSKLLGEDIGKKTIFEIIKILRKEAGVSAQSLADLFNKSFGWVYLYEKGKGHLSEDDLRKALALFEIPELFYDGIIACWQRDDIPKKRGWGHSPKTPETDSEGADLADNNQGMPPPTVIKQTPAIWRYFEIMSKQKGIPLAGYNGNGYQVSDFADDSDPSRRLVQAGLVVKAIKLSVKDIDRLAWLLFTCYEGCPYHIYVQGSSTEFLQYAINMLAATDGDVITDKEEKISGSFDKNTFSNLLQKYTILAGLYGLDYLGRNKMVNTADLFGDDNNKRLAAIGRFVHHTRLSQEDIGIIALFINLCYKGDYGYSVIGSGIDFINNTLNVLAFANKASVVE